MGKKGAKKTKGEAPKGKKEGSHRGPMREKNRKKKETRYKLDENEFISSWEVLNVEGFVKLQLMGAA